jgi:hypothetical protein
MLALRIAIFAALVPWRFRRPLRQLEAQLESRIEPSRMAQQPNAGEADRIIRLTGMLCRAVRPLLSHPCQVRGLTLYYFLRRVGVDVSLVFGVAPEATGAVGHCWLVKDGEPYLESVDPREHFISMYSFNAHQTSAGSSGAERSRE